VITIMPSPEQLLKEKAVVENFLSNYDGLRSQFLNKKQIAEALGITSTKLKKLVDTHNKPEAIKGYERWTPLVKQHLIEKGGTVKAALRSLGAPEGVAAKVTELLKEQGFEYHLYLYNNVRLGCYIGHLLEPEELEKPYNTRRIKVTCARCGTEHFITMPQFSAARQSQCSACPNQRKISRHFLIVETQEIFNSLREIHRNYFDNQLGYQTLRLKVLRDGFYKSNDGSITVTLLSDTAEDRVAVAAKSSTARPHIARVDEAADYLKQQDLVMSM